MMLCVGHLIFLDGSVKSVRNVDFQKQAGPSIPGLK